VPRVSPIIAVHALRASPAPPPARRRGPIDGQRGDFLVLDEVAEAVRAQQEDVAGADGQRLFPVRNLDVSMGAEGPQDDVAIGVVPRLGARQQAARDQLADRRVVVGHAIDAAVAQQVEAAVADAGRVGVAVADRERDAGRAHPAEALLG
jgi:hypothetical protein